MSRRIFRTAALGIAGFVALILLISGIWVREASARSNVGAPVRAGTTTGHTINVAGHGEVRVTPDQATITVGVQSSGESAAAALSTNNTHMNAVIAAVEGQGVPAANVQTTDLSLWYDSQRNVYVATHSLTILLDAVNRVGPVLDAAVGAGANNSWGVSFGVKNSAAAHVQALQAAVSDARRRADGLASALGVTISGVGSVSESSYSSPPIDTASRGAAVAPSTPVQPGQVVVAADISVTYTFG